MWTKASKKPVIWFFILGLCMAFILALPSFSSDSALNYFNQLGLNGDGNNKSTSWFSWSSSSNRPGDPTCVSPLKVYMYDLPRKYNMGILDEDGSSNQELPWTSPVVPSWEQKSTNKQHSAEFWMMAYLLNDFQDGKHTAVRVKDPVQADVFFVPFFSSLSLNQYHKSGRDEQNQADVVDILSKSPWYQASQGRDHVIAVHHPNSLRYYRELLNQSIFIVADFGRLEKNVSRLQKDVVAPYQHVVPSYNQDNTMFPFSSRKTLLFFRGRVHRKADGYVRTKLEQLLANTSDVYYENSQDVSDEAIVMATEGMRSSRFCLHLAGDTPSSCRLFDIIVSHCIPVIISDKIELPFEADLDYSEFSIFLSAEQALQPGHLLDTLRSITENKWMQMWERLKAVVHHFEYQHPAKQDDAVNMIFKQVQRKVSPMKLSLHRSQRLKIPDWWRR